MQQSQEATVMVRCAAWSDVLPAVVLVWCSFRSIAVRCELLLYPLMCVARCLHVALHDDAVVGVACNGLLDPGRVGHVCVEKDYQGNGVGALLVRVAEQRAYELGRSYVLVGAAPGAVAFYARRGYDVLHVVHMRKRLPSKISQDERAV